MVLLGLIVSLPRLIWLTSVPIAMTLVRAVARKWPFMLAFQVCPGLESSLVEKLDWKGNVKLCRVPAGVRVLIWLVLTATNSTSLSTVSKWVYIWYVLGYMCCKEDCSSDSLTWFLWLGTNVKFCELRLLPRVLNSVLQSSELVIKCLHTDGRKLLSAILIWQSP